VPALFTAAAYRHELGPRDTVLALPIGIAGQGMLWQAQARLRFAMAGGYIAPPEAPDPYKRFAVYPTLTYGAPVPGQMRATEEFLRATHVTVAVLDEASAAGSPWPRLLEQLGWQPRHVGGALLLRPTPAGGHVGGGAAAVRAVAARSFSRFAVGDALGFCATLTAEARGRLTRSATATPAACAAAFAPIMRGSPALRAVSGKARIGAARVTGTLATVTVRLPGRPAARLPARLVDGRWLVDGSLAGPAGSS
jgi:hypothetical protein